MATVSFKIDADPVAWAIQTLDATKGTALVLADQFVKKHQASGWFPKDPNEYTLLLRNRGSTNRRKSILSIHPAYLRVPFNITAVAASDDMEDVVQAAIYAKEQIIRRSPVRTGRYRDSVGIYINGVMRNTLDAEFLRPTDFITVVPVMHYASSIERGFAKRQYNTQRIPGGIVRPVAKLVRAKFGHAVSCRFSYAIPPRGTEAASFNYLQPMIEIGVGGSFLPNDASNTRAYKPRRRR